MTDGNHVSMHGHMRGPVPMKVSRKCDNGRAAGMYSPSEQFEVKYSRQHKSDHCAAGRPHKSHQVGEVRNSQNHHARQNDHEETQRILKRNLPI